ncbi:asparagine synthetase B family protein [Pelomicrobium sp. G1]|uniref:asparagine synthetase B family protein n=1 Tax=unclassified Pelomicrobium TaxID=2815318 RepID=UPI003F75C902
MREALIYGWVDFSGVRPGGAPRVDQRPQGGPAQRWTAPGLEVVVDPLAADVAVQDTAMALTWGRPRFEAEAGGGAADLSPARCWLRLYRRHGAAVAPMVKGPYAVAILDFAQGRGVLAVDRFARESLCYAREGTRLAFSNRADRVPLVRAPELDPQALFDYLYFHMIPAPRTVFRGVSRLPAGHALEANRDGVRVQRHWVPRFEEERPAPLRSLAEEFRRLVREAVAREADGAAVGCFLSGGTDSSTVTGMLQEVTGRPARSFSIGFDAAGYDEMAYARIAVRHFGAEHYEHYLTPEELVEGIPRVAAHYDQPFGNSSVLPAYRCAQLAASAGVEKLLAGDGGDELFGGNARYATQKLFALYEAIPAPVRRRLVEPLLADSTAFARLPLVRKAAAYVRHARLPMPDRLETYNLLTRLGAEHLLAADFLASVDQAAPLAQQRAVYGASSARALVNRMLEYDWKYTLADNDLPKVLGATALAGVQAAFPFLAEELVDFSLRLPPRLKVRGLRLRYFFKEALRGFLPEAILRKKKHGFGLPFGVWVLRHPGLRELAFASLDALGERGMVRKTFLRELIQSHLPQHPGYYGEMVWILMMLEQWLQARERQARAERPAAIA